MKRLRPGLSARLRKGAATGWGAASTTVAIVAAGTTALGLTGREIFASVFGSSFIVGLLAAYIRGRLSYIPQIVIDDMGHDQGCKCKRVTAGELRTACELTRPYYAQEYVSFDVAEKWRRKNPEAFLQVVNEEGEMCSCFGFIAMSDSCFDEFIKGRIKDGQFDEEDILDAQETKKSPRLYLSGVIVNEAHTLLGGKRATMMVSVMLNYYKKYFGLRKKRTIFALAVSKEGEQILKKTHFTLVSDKAVRSDGCNLYKLEMDQATWTRIAHEFPDWSLCYEMVE